MTTITTIMRKLRMRGPLCCCASCIAHFPERARILRSGKAMLQRDESLRNRKGKPAKEEVS